VKRRNREALIPRRPVSTVMLALIGVYQRWISPALPQRCKYYPTCSAYTAQAIRELGPVRGSIVGAWRILRCNPLSDGGIDELEDRKLFPGHRRRHRHQRPALPPVGGSAGPDLS
jgi:putative membrane protein insertion efficiency factor